MKGKQYMPSPDTKELCYLGSVQPPPETRRVEHSSNDPAEQTRAGTGGDVTCLLPSAKAGGGNLATVMSPLCGALAPGRCAARGCQGHGPVAGGATATWKWSLGLLSQVSQYHSTIQHQLRNAAAMLLSSRRKRQGQHFME